MTVSELQNGTNNRFINTPWRAIERHEANVGSSLRSNVAISVRPLPRISGTLQQFPFRAKMQGWECGAKDPGLSGQMAGQEALE